MPNSWRAAGAGEIDLFEGAIEIRGASGRCTLGRAPGLVPGMKPCCLNGDTLVHELPNVG